MSDTDVCRAAHSAVKSGDRSFSETTADEAKRRGLTPDGCVSLVNQANATAAAAAIAVIGIAALIAVSRRGGGGGGYAPSQQTADYSWDWDMFYNEARQPVWACRGVQTGQFANLDQCQFKSKSDVRWPGLVAPAR